MAEVLAKALGTDMGPAARRTAAEERRTGAEAEIGRLTKEKGEFDVLREADVATREAERARARGEALKAERKTIEESPERQALVKTEEDLSTAAFVPTQETAASLGTMFSLLNIVGFAIGAGGKQNAQAAMSAMNGMLEGYQKGRADLYNKERQAFDASLKALKTRSDVLGRRLQEIAKLAQTDRQAADAEADALFAEQGASFLKQYKEKAGLAATIEYQKTVAKDAQRIIEEANKQLDRESLERQRAAERAEMQRQRLEAQAELQRERLEAKTDKFTQQQAMAQRAVNSLGGVASALESLQELPAGTTTGLLPNLQTKDGMMNYVRNMMGRKVSSREAEIMNTLFTGVGRNLASIEASGVATGLSELSKQMQSGVYINAGVDDPYKVAIKLADIRRIAIENIIPAIESGAMPEKQAATARKLVERIEKAVPFSTSDVIRAANAPGRPTIGAVTQQAVTGAPAQAYEDPEKERRYQEWKARQAQ